MTNVIDTCYVTTPQATTSTRTKEKLLDIFPYTITQRSFAPWKRFGDLLGIDNILIKDKRFEGDNRGFSLIDSNREKNNKASARLNQITQIKTNKENVVDDDAFANRTIGYRSIGVVIPTSFNQKIGTGNVKSKATFNANKLTMSVWGSNPLVKLAPDIDWELYIKFIIINQDGIKTLELNCISSGRGFPAYEAFISDSKNNKFFLFTLPAPSRNELAKELTYPMHDLRRENTIRVEIDNDGNFKRNISVSNSEMSKTPLHGLNKGHQHIFTTIPKWNEYNLKKLSAPDCESNECGKNR